MILQLSEIEEELSRQGYFSLIDWLLKHNHLAYSDYEAWRYGRVDTLDDRLQLTEKELDDLIHAIEAYALSLELSASPVDYYAWDDNREMLHACDSANRHQGLVSRWQRAQDIPQMDLFMDNTSLFTENALADALAERNWEQAEEALQRLTRLNPAHRQLGVYVDLLNYGRHMQANMVLSPDAVAPELQGLDQEVSPLAKELLGPNARDYLAFAWRRMADNMQGIAFDPARPEWHLSYALQQIPDWSALEQLLVADQQLYEHPQLMERLISSFQATGQHAQADALWCLLFDYSPDQAESFMELHRDQPIHSVWDDFWEFYADWDVSLFTSFILISQPGLLHHLKQLPSLKHAANLATVDLLQCKRAGQNETDARRGLQALSPRLLSFYLQCH